MWCRAARERGKTHTYTHTQKAGGKRGEAGEGGGGKEKGGGVKRKSKEIRGNRRKSSHTNVYIHAHMHTQPHSPTHTDTGAPAGT